MPRRATAPTPSRRLGTARRIDDAGLLTPPQTSLLIDQYELAMAASYLRRGMNDPAVFELFVRHLPPHRDWLLVAGLGPALTLVEAMRFGRDELGYLRCRGFDARLLDYLARFRFSARIDAMPEGTVAFYVMSFPTELEAFRAFMQDTPENAVMLVDTHDTERGVRNAIAASHATGVPLAGVRLDSGDHLALAHRARALLDEAGMSDATIIVSGDLDECHIAGLVGAGAPVDMWGVGTDLGTSRDSPAVGGVYKLVADRADGHWRPGAAAHP